MDPQLHRRKGFILMFVGVTKTKHAAQEVGDGFGPSIAFLAMVKVGDVFFKCCKTRRQFDV